MKADIELNYDAISLRKRMGESESLPIDIFTIVRAVENLTLVLYPMSTRMSGMCVRVEENDLIAVNSTSSYGRQRFTLAHELYHLKFQKNLTKVYCGMELWGGKDDEEKNANTFASFFLAPYDSFRDFVGGLLSRNENHEINIAEIVKIEQYFGMSRQATLFRLQREGYITSEFANTQKINVIRSARMFGYDDSLYVSLPEERRYLTTGNYVELAERLREKAIVSQGKYEELLLDAYRSDIVYGANEDREAYD